jgi:hypothetical protein
VELHGTNVELGANSKMAAKAGSARLNSGTGVLGCNDMDDTGINGNIETTL